MTRREIDTVLFDLDGTICRYRRDGADVLEGAFEAVGVDPYFTQDAYIEMLQTLSVECSSFTELREECFAELSNQVGRDPSIGRAVARAYADARDQTNVSWCPGAEQSVEALADRYALGLVTNASREIQRPKLETLGVHDRFETIVYAGYDTAAKPDPEPFHRALCTLDSAPERAVHVGNSIPADVRGAHRAGVTSVWVSDGSDPDRTPDFTVATLDELVDPPWEAASHV